MRRPCCPERSRDPKGEVEVQLSNGAVLHPPATLAGLLVLTRARERAVGEAMLIVGGAACVALCAQIAVALPFTPVPLTGQTLAVLLTGAALGASRAGLSMLLYIAVGVLGLPVFASDGSGWAALSGPTAGYLMGFVAAAVVAGRMAERRWDRRFASALCAMVVGSVLIYAFGCGWLAVSLGVSPARALSLGLYPFLVGDLIKLALGAAMLPLAWRTVGRARRLPGDRQR
jgi:biotin transport system substrate-specific component